MNRSIKEYVISTILMLFSVCSIGQVTQKQIDNVQSEVDAYKLKIEELTHQLGILKLEFYKGKYRDQLGLPADADIIEHKAMFLTYDENHEQAKWVAHVILPEIVDVGAGRTNDFRVDPKVKTGTAIEIDYFLKKLLPDSTYEYDGYGYDRGHLAPSADFRWNAEAVSESYYYSNMSPMLDVFNREIWSEIEDAMRQYVIRNQVALYVVTAPILTADLPKIARSVNGVSIPEKYIKVAVDLVNKRAIGFVLRNEKAESPIDAFATSVDYVEELTGYNFFPKLNEDIEKNIDKQDWFKDGDEDMVMPISPALLKEGYFNTIYGGRKKGLHKNVKVCGTVVAGRYSRSGNAWLNLDRKYPNDYFSIMIKKESLTNLDYDPVSILINDQVCFEGDVVDIGKKPVIIIKKQKEIKPLKSL